MTNEVASMKGWGKIGPLVVAIGVTVSLALLLGPEGLLASGGEQGEVTATVRVNPLDVTVSATPLKLAVGDSFRLDALVQNKGDTRLTNVRASILFDISGLRLRGSSGRNLGTIGPESTKLVRWRFKALEKGDYILLVNVEALERETGTFLHAQGSVIVVVVD